jgi:biopolymer transport protein ExbD
MSRPNAGTGLESAPDIMLLTMAALMVAIVWLASLAHETALPPIDLPSADSATLGALDRAAAKVTLSPGADGALEVFLEKKAVAGGLGGLEAALRERSATAVVLRADEAIRWRDALTAMSAAARLDLPISIAVER